MQNDSMMKKLQIMICILGLLGLNSCSDYLNKESSDEVIVKTVSDYSELLLGAGYPEPTGSLLTPCICWMTITCSMKVLWMTKKITAVP